MVMRSLEFAAGVVVGFAGRNRASDYARELLGQLGVREVPPAELPAGAPLIVAGDDVAACTTWGGKGDRGEGAHPFIVRLWDFQVGRAGTGLQSSIVSGVSCVIGLAARPPLGLPAHLPEKWCGLLGAAIAMTAHVQAEAAPRQHFDVSSADILRGFADQNFANHKEFPDSWRRNGRVTLEHGGIYPQGFFPCKDGYVAVVGRSKADWENILAALGKPAWAQGELLDPVHLATHPELVDDLFLGELARFSRDQLLEVALECGATFAPVYTPLEAAARELVPADLYGADGAPRLPFTFFPVV